MEALEVVSITVGVVSIILAAVAIVISILVYMRTKDVLSEVDKKASVIEKAVTETQNKLIDTVTEIAKPARETQEEMLMRTMLPAMMNNPDLLQRFMDAGAKQQQTQDETDSD